MFSHVMIGSNDTARSKKFYDALFVAMGAQPGVEDARGRLAYAHNGGRFMMSKPIDGKPASHANGGTIGFTMSDAKQAEAWHKAGVAHGGCLNYRRSSLKRAALSGRPSRAKELGSAQLAARLKTLSSGSALAGAA